MNDTRRRSHNRVCESWIGATEMPTLVRVRPNLVCACFPLMKLLPARRMIDATEADGLITPRTSIVETTSGTLGLGLALVCAARGYEVFLVGDPVIDAQFQTRLELLGAHVELVNAPAPVGGFQTARLERVQEIAEIGRASCRERV